ncbi:MAG: RNA-binding cell elongation regulator Jag/EloR [Nitrososphaerales archaeon]
MTGEKSGEFRGKSVEAAIAAGLLALRLNREDVEVEIVRPGSRGVLGIGAEDAVVRLTAVPRGAPEALSAPRVESPEPRPSQPPATRQEPKPSQPARTAEPKPAPVVAPVTPPAGGAAAAGTAEERAAAAAEKGRELLLGILQRMDLDADVEIVPQSDAETDEHERALVLNIVGDDLGVLIGRQNETLSSIEFVTRLMVNQQVHTRTNFAVDVNGYRAKRAESLRKLALRMAEQVAETGRTVALEPMPPAERRIIHLALRDHPSVMTQSIGEGDRRKVTIVARK